MSSFVEKYSSSTAGGGGDGSVGNPWTFTQGITALSNGQRLNHKGNITLTGTPYVLLNGATNNLKEIRGYYQTPGDLDELKFDNNGFMVTTNFPIITVATNSSLTLGYGVNLKNLVINGSCNTVLVFGNPPGASTVQNCKITNTYTGEYAGVIGLSSDCLFRHCEFNLVTENTEAEPGAIAYAWYRTHFDGCRVTSSNPGKGLIMIENGIVENCTFANVPSGIALQINDSQQNLFFHGGNRIVNHNTFYNVGTCIRLPETWARGNVQVSNNHATDSNYLVVAGQDFDTFTIIGGNNRIRDVSNLYDNLVFLAISPDITTDNGGHTTDYIDAPNGNFYLKSTAAGTNKATRPLTNIGAWQGIPVTGGGDN